MIKKVILNYDEDKLELTDIHGKIICNVANLEYEESLEVTELCGPLRVGDVCMLKEAGFTVDEIGKLHKQGII